ncbi:metallophosphoesterase [Virgibacillus halophilus]|uniref:metallophosphoesterase n=1 Tax=Tigheibacillus halophilus TaxID=361280 RepID=UPI00362DE1D9
MERLLAIGDIHGELSLFETLLKKAAYDPQKDQLILIGDYIDRGPDSCGVLEKVMDLHEKGAIVLRGNHEEMLLSAMDESSGSLEHWLRNGASETIASYMGDAAAENAADVLADSEIFKKHVCFIRERDYIFQTPDYLFVHAGLDPNQPLSEMDKHTFVWIREPFFSDYRGEKTVVFGHTPTAYLHGDNDCHTVYFGDNRIIGIDGGAVFGGQLNCLELPSKHVFSVHA